MKRKKVTNELIASFLYSSRQMTASNVLKMLHKCSYSQRVSSKNIHWQVTSPPRTTTKPLNPAVLLISELMFFQIISHPLRTTGC